MRPRGALFGCAFRSSPSGVAERLSSSARVLTALSSSGSGTAGSARPSQLVARDRCKQAACVLQNHESMLACGGVLVVLCGAGIKTWRVTRVLKSYCESLSMESGV